MTDVLDELELMRARVDDLAGQVLWLTDMVVALRDYVDPDGEYEVVEVRPIVDVPGPDNYPRPRYRPDMPDGMVIE